ncbi:glycosyltransferase [Litoribaculum gwangyangense]|uniref:Glycosyltransferase 2-like domain-containing protein n=1 Tax=Litoribaculum gwangyangense TaxID=1130722 RepID=A0ABP9CRF5_9FLAO
MISVVIRNKNQSKALEFLLSNLTRRYSKDIDEVIVVDNLSTDNSKEIANKYNARFETISKFSYGGSANFCAEKANNEIIAIFSAHSYPVSPDFFSKIKKAFEYNKNLAGVRCLHSSNDYKNYIQNISAKQDPNKSGLIFSGSAFRKSVWEKIKFNENVPTFEDKDWTKRVLKAGYDIEFAPVVFNYNISRNSRQLFFRFKNDVVGNYQIWHEEPKLSSVLKGTMYSILNAFKVLLESIFYATKRLLFMLKFKFNKPEKFEY